MVKLSLQHPFVRNTCSELWKPRLPLGRYLLKVKIRVFKTLVDVASVSLLLTLNQYFFNRLKCYVLSTQEWT